LVITKSIISYIFYFLRRQTGLTANIINSNTRLFQELYQGVVATLKQLKMGFFCIFGFSNQRNTMEKSVKSPNKPTYKIVNWKEYNASLQKRGKITLWIDAEMLRKWNEVDNKFTQCGMPNCRKN
jgi:hypothetical protein